MGLFTSENDQPASKTELEVCLQVLVSLQKRMEAGMKIKRDKLNTEKMIVYLIFEASVSFWNNSLVLSFFSCHCQIIIIYLKAI